MLYKAKVAVCSEETQMQCKHRVEFLIVVIWRSSWQASEGSNRCRYQSITQQYLKRCLIKDDSNYMFRPNVAIIRFLSESMVVVLYRIGMGMSRW